MLWLLSDDHGDRPRPLPKIKELQGATDITERKGRPSWDYVVCTSVSSSNVTVLCYEWLILCCDRRKKAGNGWCLHQSAKSLFCLGILRLTNKSGEQQSVLICLWLRDCWKVCALLFDLFWGDYYDVLNALSQNYFYFPWSCRVWLFHLSGVD